jgi:hypothetical protein
MTSMTHSTHAMSRTAHSTRSMRAMEFRMGGPEVRTVIDPSHGIHLAAVALAYLTGTLAMELLAVDVLGMRRSLA